MHYKVFPATEPGSLEKFRVLRLTSLKVDPSLFCSTYECEITFTPEMWMKRLTSPFRRTFIATVKDKEENNGETWVGMVTILGPSGLITATLEPLERAGVGADWDMYMVVGMWVHPEHRGRGLGTRLVREGLEWARTNMDPKNNTEGRRDKMVLLQVLDRNASGRALYQKAGFSDLTSITPNEEGHMWMSLKVA
ncbi:acyl-CoA N-acyltransferase [Rhizopogon vinicolor AM-OR11-026]|uniref:Acyl-CoA N-acyltransferase n=1 Tax=Rhizopogon vinicolor AM-OR11-026 TaxID=1314800 RepID=A0A1B7MMU7_9AGAM|nr:acyl-CoA N-acyltransferase [Rhizopogon vinicolor AM-OR11-026]